MLDIAMRPARCTSRFQRFNNNPPHHSIHWGTLKDYALNTKTRTARTYAYYVDVEGQGGPRYGSLDWEMLSNISPKHHDEIASAIFADRIVGIDLMRETRAALYDDTGKLVSHLELRCSGEPCEAERGKALRHQNLTYRFLYECDEPIDLDTFQIQAIARERHGGCFLSSIEINGTVLDPVLSPSAN